jgi:hypothetical protein
MIGLGSIWNGVAVALLGYCFGISLEGLGITTKILRQERQCLSQDSDLTPPEYQSTVYRCANLPVRRCEFEVRYLIAETDTDVMKDCISLYFGKSQKLFRRNISIQSSGSQSGQSKNPAEPCFQPTSAALLIIIP